jgi:hypothetical protein
LSAACDELVCPYCGTPPARSVALICAGCREYLGYTRLITRGVWDERRAGGGSAARRSSWRFRLEKGAASVKRHPLLTALGATAAVVLLALLIVHWVPDWLGQTPRGFTGVQVDEERGRIRTALLALLVGVVAVPGAIFAGLTFRLSRQGQDIDRFTRAIGQLGAITIDVRLGGIYALERLASESATYRGPILDVLAGYIREHAGLKGHGASNSGPLAQQFGEFASDVLRHTLSSPTDPTGDAAVDVRAAVVVLARRDTTEETEPPRFDFSKTNLRGVRAEGIHLQGCLLTDAHLENARLEGAQLQRAVLVGAYLKGARFAGADFAGASLSHAHLEGAFLDKAEGLDKATLDGATYDEVSTTFPKGFDPTKYGARPVTRT